MAGDIVDLLMSRWQNASLTDYAHVILAVVLLGWLIIRLSPDR